MFGMHNKLDDVYNTNARIQQELEPNLLKLLVKLNDKMDKVCWLLALCNKLMKCNNKKT